MEREATTVVAPWFRPCLNGCSAHEQKVACTRRLGLRPISAKIRTFGVENVPIFGVRNRQPMTKKWAIWTYLSAYGLRPRRLASAWRGVSVPPPFRNLAHSRTLVATISEPGSFPDSGGHQWCRRASAAPRICSAGLYARSPHVRPIGVCSNSCRAADSSLPRETPPAPALPVKNTNVAVGAQPLLRSYPHEAPAAEWFLWSNPC